MVLEEIKKPTILHAGVVCLSIPNVNISKLNEKSSGKYRDHPKKATIKYLFLILICRLFVK